MRTTSLQSPAAVHSGHGGGLPPVRRVLASVTVPARAEAVPGLRRLARAATDGADVSAEVREALAVIVTELATNVVLHSGSSDLSVVFELCDTALTVRVRDGGRWRERSAPRCEPADVDAVFGRGLGLVRAFAAHTSVLRTAGGTVVEAVIARGPAVPG
ncbi:hypothetical protein KNE206_05700 [Kitasatospora sp. NE20-6]|uniref:ATP-binding protein n=1 Tax=Kitasatospora sp. NE20-6 TaxID=2859066 RepID=UPI0034DC723B